MTVVVALGRSTRGQLGLDDEQRKKKAFSVAPTIAFQTLGCGPSDRVVMAACGADFTLLLLKSGLVWSSGCNSTGQLGNPAVGAFSARPIPVKDLHEVLKISCGSHHAAAITQAGEAFVWGLNDSGQLGLDHRKQCSVPTKFKDPTFADEEALATASIISAPSEPDQDNLPHHTDDADILRRKLCHPRGSWPEFVAGIEDRMYGWCETACGLQHTIASYRSHSQRELHIMSCGSGASGCLGHGDTADQLAPLEIAEVRIRMLDVIQVAAGSYHSVLLCRDSSVWTFGFSSEGRLGLGTTQISANLRVPRRVPNGLGMRQSQSASGLGMEGARIPARSRASGLDQFRTCVPRRVEGLTGVPIVQVACGSSHSVALTADGSVWGWGCDKFGQLSGRKSQMTTPKPIASLCNRGIVGLECGAYHTAAITGQGSLLLVGMNEEGQCGGDAPRSSGIRGGVIKQSDGCVRDPRTLNEAVGISNVACGDGHTIVIAKDGPQVSSDDEGEGDDMPLPSTVRKLPSVTKTPSGALLKQPRLKFSRSTPSMSTLGAEEVRRLAPLDERFGNVLRMQSDSPPPLSPVSPVKHSSSGLFQLPSTREMNSRHSLNARVRGDVPRIEGLTSATSVAEMMAADISGYATRAQGLSVETPDLDQSDLLMSLAAEKALAAYASNPSVVSPDHLKRHKFVFGASLSSANVAV